jgi:spore maturation protein CgeB
MKITIFGLTITSSWGNGHATIWRGLCKSLIKRGHQISFFEKDVSYYADQRDLTFIKGMNIYLYKLWEEIEEFAKQQINDSDVSIVTSYCPEGIEASELIFLSNPGLKIFYDLDTPVTLKNFELDEAVPYIHPDGLGGFDVVLSYTGGEALNELKDKLKAKETATLYGSADPDTHLPVKPLETYLSDLSYLGTYSADRQEKLQRFFLDPALFLNEKKFLLAGSLYPENIWYPSNVKYFYHIPPSEHPSFYCSSRFTLNITRGAMAAMGYCPSGRLFEAAACGVPIISDYWKGLEFFFEPGKEIFVVNSAEDVIKLLNMNEYEKNEVAEAARKRVLVSHTSDNRAIEFEKIVLSKLKAKEGDTICGV